MRIPGFGDQAPGETGGAEDDGVERLFPAPSALVRTLIS
jgi:hypothetical protein